MLVRYVSLQGLTTQVIKEVDAYYVIYQQTSQERRGEERRGEEKTKREREERRGRKGEEVMRWDQTDWHGPVCKICIVLVVVVFLDQDGFTCLVPYISTDPYYTGQAVTYWGTFVRY